MLGQVRSGLQRHTVFDASMCNVGQVSGAFVSGKTQASPNSCCDYISTTACMHAFQGRDTSVRDDLSSGLKILGIDDPCKNVQEYLVQTSLWHKFFRVKCTCLSLPSLGSFLKVGISRKDRIVTECAVCTNNACYLFFARKKSLLFHFM